MKWLLVTITLGLIWQGAAHATPADDAARAAADLRAAMVTLQNVDKRRDRVRALTQTIDAIEGGMAALRQGLRGTAVQEKTIRAKLTGQEVEIAQLLGNLQILGRSDDPTFLLHPMGPTGTARAGMIMADITPALQARVDRLKSDLALLRQLQSVQLDAQQVLQSALNDVKLARVQLSQAISNRTALPRRFFEDATKTALLLASTDTLDAFANSIALIAVNEVPIPLPAATDIMGTIPLPVRGQLLRGFNERDAAGVRRPGLIYLTTPGALVTAPASSTIRYQGPLLHYGQVVILEPAADVLIVMGGMAQILVKTGEVVIKGAPLGLMHDDQGPGNTGQDTLYIEVRQNQKPVDPMTWFAVR
ncbi:MAG: murein hydrolase activator EnvC family protein [Planktomarina sp.]